MCVAGNERKNKSVHRSGGAASMFVITAPRVSLITTAAHQYFDLMVWLFQGARAGWNVSDDVLRFEFLRHFVVGASEVMIHDGKINSPASQICQLGQFALGIFQEREILRGLDVVTAAEDAIEHAVGALHIVP